MPPTLKDVADYLGLQSEKQMASKLGLHSPISTLALIEKYKLLPPKAHFSVNPSFGPMPLNVQFTDESLGYITKWDWKFDDGGTDAHPSPSHQYRSPKQLFTGQDFQLADCSAWAPTLTVSNKGGSNTATGSVTVYPAPPTAKFGEAYADQQHPLLWYFSVDKSSGYCLTHSWNFGDPASGSKNSASTSGQEGTQHTFSGPGNFTVEVTVSNSAGSSSAAMTIAVVGSAGSGPGSGTQTPVIQAGWDPAAKGTLLISGSKFTPSGAIAVNITKKDEQGHDVLVVSPAPVVFADKTTGVLEQQSISVAPCSGTGPDGFQINIQAVDQTSKAGSNSVPLTCYATDMP